MTDRRTQTDDDLAWELRYYRSDLAANRNFATDYQNGRLQAVAAGLPPEFFREQVLRAKAGRQAESARMVADIEAELSRRQGVGA